MSCNKIKPISSTNNKLSNLIYINEKIDINNNPVSISENILLNQFNWLDNKLETIINLEEINNSNPPEPIIPSKSAVPLTTPASSIKLKKKLSYIFIFSAIGISSLILCLILFL